MRFAEAQQRVQAAGLGGAAFELAIAQLQAVQLGTHLLVLAAGVAQGDVVVPAAADPINRPRAGTLNRRDHRRGPDADQPHLALLFDLHRQKEHLRNHRSRQQQQRPMT